MPERGGEDEHPIRTDLTTTTSENGLSTMKSSCICGKVCKNERGLKIHQALMKCLVQEMVAQRTGSKPSETQEEPGPEVRHRVLNLQVPSSPIISRVSQQLQIKWPPAKQHKLWQQFDEDTARIINATTKGGIEGRIQNLTSIITSFATERFGVGEPKSSKPTYTKNRREDKIEQFRKELRMLTKQFKAAAEEDKPLLAEIRYTIRKKLMTLRRTKWHRRRRIERARRRTSVLADPFGFRKRLLGEKRSGRLDCSKEEVDHFLHNTLSDPERARARIAESSSRCTSTRSGV